MVIQRVSSATMAKEVLYIGSAVPLETSEGLDAVQQPLRSRYPVENDDNIQGILSTLTILPTGIQLRYQADPNNVVLFPFSALTMCAAVRCVNTTNAATKEVSSKFVSLSSPEAGGPNSERPAIFTAITRRTKGRQVLECHGFITMTPKDALELVQWTSTMDKRSKQSSFHTLSGGMTSASSYDVSRGDTSFRAETASLPDFPIQLVPGDPMPANTSPAFYKEPPRTGYFYSTKNAHVKKYSLQKFSGSTGVDDTPSVIPAGADHFERVPRSAHAGYAASHYSASAAMPPAHPRQPIMVPVRPIRPIGPMGAPPPAFMRPVIIAPPQYPPSAFARPRFFSPPPPMAVLRPRPIPVMVPPPPGPYYYDDEYPTLRSRAGRRGSRGSSRSSSGSSSPDSPRVNGKPPKKGHANHDDSSGSSSRPRTPPTDYDAPRGPRVSRKDEYYFRQNYSKEGLKKGARGPPGFYVVPPYGYYGGPPPPGFERARSVPPYGENTSKKQKDKKGKKSKKSKKGSKKHGHRDPYDESTDSVGYMSELGPNGESRQPRDFRRPENQFTHERAFSKSLAEETRHSTRGDSMFNAYALNNTAPAGNEQDFPMY